MDCETGELTFIDLETGEICYKPSLNCETGEQEYGVTIYRSPIRRFKIPTYLYRKQKEMTLVHRKKQPVIKKSTQRTELIASLLFLLPTTICFAPILGIIVLLLEVFLHTWSHRLNSKLKQNDHVFFQSPLHNVCKEFCGICRDEGMKQKITKLQEERNDNRKLKKFGLEYIVT